MVEILVTKEPKDIGHFCKLTIKSPSNKDVDIFLKENSVFGEYGGPSMYMLVLNNEQVKKLGKVVKENGFKCIAKNYHANHDSYIHIFIKKNPKKRVKK